MTVHFVYIEEQHPEGRPLRYEPTLFDQIMAITGYRARYVRSLAEANDLAEHEWIYLDHRAKRSIADLEHPSGDVVYCAGSDGEGFTDQVMVPGIRVRIGDVERYAFPMLIVAACDRWSRTRAWQ